MHSSEASPRGTLSRTAILASACLVWLASATFASGSAWASESGSGSESAFRAFVSELLDEARREGISESVLLEARSRLRSPDSAALSSLSSQAEFSVSAGVYISRRVTDERVRIGRRLLNDMRSELGAIEERYGVDRFILLAIWGLESHYGARRGDRDALKASATLAWKGRRKAFWRQQFFSALEIASSGAATLDELRGSWAGAMGHMQFIPSTYLAYAVDWNGDGRKDVWNDAAEALASAANYLRRSGWRRGEGWAREAILPRGFDVSLAGLRRPLPLRRWRELGVRDADGSLPSGGGEAAAVLPSGANGPAFLAGENFSALLKYNRSVSYALSVSLLATRLAGGDDVAAAWPPEARPLSTSEREELQRLLRRAGFYRGAIDGLIGSQTADALRRWQLNQGIPADGFAGKTVLYRLRQNATYSAFRQNYGK